MRSESGAGDHMFFISTFPYLGIFLADRGSLWQERRSKIATEQKYETTNTVQFDQVLE